MINYYEYLELDMNASVDELNHAIQVSERDDADLKFIREMKSILLNNEARALYNNKLISFIVGDRKSLIW
jgi:methyl coenzyme M reductase beta subunit